MTSIWRPYVIDLTAFFFLKAGARRTEKRHRHAVAVPPHPWLFLFQGDSPPMIPIVELLEHKDETRPTLREMETCVVSLCSGSFVRIPPWFSVGGALQVARFKNARFVLVEDNGQVLAMANTETLEVAPSAQVLRRTASPVTLRMKPETTWREGLAILRRTGLEAMLVANESLLVGVITRDTLERIEASQS